MERASEIAALRQMLAYYASAQPQAASQAALVQLARAYSDLVVRYGGLAADIEALKRAEGERRAREETLARTPVAPPPSRAVSAPKKPPAPPQERSVDAPIDPFSDRF